MFDPLEAGQGVVAVLGHFGNWDHAGAWVTGRGFHVTTVAERLKPESLFDQFVEYRESLGMTVLPLTEGPDTHRCPSGMPSRRRLGGAAGRPRLDQQRSRRRPARRVCHACRSVRPCWRYARTPCCFRWSRGTTRGQRPHAPRVSAAADLDGNGATRPAQRLDAAVGRPLSGRLREITRRTGTCCSRSGTPTGASHEGPAS